ncbi:lipoyl(octanoyl) transferase LipB [soil metagenome]
MDKQLVNYKDLGVIDYKTAWAYQEKLLQENVKIKSINAKRTVETNEAVLVPNCSTPAEDILNSGLAKTAENLRSADSNVLSTLELNNSTTNYLLLCEHPPVYTLGKSGHEENILISESEMQRQGIQYFKTNRGGDITFHGPQQIVGYPIIDLEKFYTDIGRYLRELEEIIILTLADYRINGERSKGETGVWIEPGVTGQERKICAMGVRCSRWITMHGFALNVNTDLNYFNNIIPCGIENKKVTSIEYELQRTVDIQEIKEKIKRNFEKVFKATLVNAD